MKRFLRPVPTLAVIALLAVLWEAASHWFGVPDYILPSLDSIFSTMADQWSGTLASATWVTTEEVLLGFALAIAVAAGLAVILHSSRILRNACYPLLIGSQAVPIVVIAPVLTIIFGFTITPKLVVVALVCFFPVVVNAVDGLAAVDPELLRVMRTLDGDRWAGYQPFWQDYFEVAEWIGTDAPDAVIVARKPTFAWYFSGGRPSFVYPFHGDPDATWRAIRSKGATHILIEPITRDFLARALAPHIDELEVAHAGPNRIAIAVRIAPATRAAPADTP